MASLRRSTAMSISFIKKGLIRSVSCGRKNLLAADSVVMPLLMSRRARMGLMLSFSPNFLAASFSAGVGC